MQTLLGILLFVSLLGAAHAQTWQLEKDESDIQVYTQVVDGSPFKAFRGTMIVSHSLTDVLGVITDASSMTDWVHECTASEVIEETDTHEKLVYQETNAPWPVSDRNFVLRITTTLGEKGESARVDFTATDSHDVKNEDCVRVTKLTGHWDLRVVEGGTRIEYQTTADPAGSIPAWLANAFVVDQPYNTLKNLRERLPASQPTSSDTDTQIY